MEPCFHAEVWAGTSVASDFNAMHIIMQVVSWNIGQLSGPLSRHIGQLSGPMSRRIGQLSGPLSRHIGQLSEPLRLVI